MEAGDDAELARLRALDERLVALHNARWDDPSPVGALQVPPVSRAASSTSDTAPSPATPPARR